MNVQEQPGKEKYPWAGPTLFIVVLVALIIFFWWFL
jgi:Mg2+ and Co2+ transporter CorA